MNKPPLTAKAVFDQALEIDSLAERTAYLEQVCADDPELGQKVASLLRAHEEAGSFMDKPANPVPATRVVPITVDDQTWTCPPPSSEGLGARIGLYTLVEQLGEGGMGAVYLAEQEQPIRRQVALKIIKPGMDSAQIVARFEAERQALTMMAHPNIARVFDAGTTERGRPYFVMELVKGIPMNRFCDENTLTLRERLHLFATVCEAIQHAHQKGVIHRDIKPTNVLVAVQDGKPVPKVIDFGLAKALHEPLIEHAHVTEYGRVVGTLEYMSPEQADSRDAGVDTRADVYSLGVMLYELLTATTPIEFSTLRDEGLTDAVRRIKEDETPRPSARVSGLGQQLPIIAAKRKTEPASLPKLLRGELDWIVLKALEKDRNRRYETVSGFAKDVQRYLDDEPVEACPPSARYRLGKFARKNRMIVLFVASLVVGVAALTAGIVKVNSERQQSEKARYWTRRALKISNAAYHRLIRKPTKLDEWDKTILRNMQRAYRELLEAEPGNSRESQVTKAETQLRVAELSALLGDHADAEEEYRKAIDLYETLADEFKDEAEYRSQLARCNFDLGILFNEQGKRSEAEAAYRRAIDLYEKLSAEFPDEAVYRRDLADAYNNLGSVLRDAEELAKAEKALREAITLGQKVAWENPRSLQLQINLAAFHHNLGNAVRDQGNANSALEWYSKAIALIIKIKTRSEDAKLYLRNAYWDRANALGLLSRHAEAIRDWRQAIFLDEGADQDNLRCFLATAHTEENLNKLTSPTGEKLYKAAAVYARATAAALATREASLRERYSKRALELLRRAKTADYFKDAQRIQEFKADPVFDPLRKDANFQAFVDSLKAGKPVE